MYVCSPLQVPIIVLVSAFDQSVDYHHQRCGRHHLRWRKVPPASGLPRGLPDQAASGVFPAVSAAAKAPGGQTFSPALFVEIV